MKPSSQRRGAPSPLSSSLLLILLLLFILLPSSLRSILAQSPGGRWAVIEVYPDGWCRISIAMTVRDPVIEISLIGQPTLLSVVDEDGLPLNYTLEGDTLVVEAEAAEEVNITYQTQSITSKRGLVWSLNVTAELDAPVSVRLIGNPDVVGLSETPIYIREGSSCLELALDPPFSLDYVYTSPSSGSEGSKKGDGNLPYYLILAPLLVAIPAIAISRRTQRRPEVDLTDRRILQSLGDGEKSLSELREELSMPKTTAWRRIRRLEREGLVEVERTKSGSLIRLTKLGKRALGSGSRMLGKGKGESEER